MKNLLSVLVVLLIGINSSSILGNNIIQGKVISEDGDPIAGVQVTDGYNFVQTKADGTYALEIFPEAAFVYITTPPGYEAPEKKGVVKFYYPLNASDQNKRTYDFVLKKIEDDYEHTFIALADVQVFRDEEFPMLNEAVKDIQKHIDSYSLKEPLHLMDLGDLVFDRMDFFPEYIASLEKTGKPVFRVVGNHDINLNNRSNAETTRSYKKYFGPDYYAFNRGEIHYVVLNDVFYLGREYFYMGYLTEQQLSWLEKDLEYVEPGSTVVVAVHIPTTRRNEKEEGFRYDRISSSLVNNNALWKILSDYNVHLLSGHTHTSSRFRIADNIVEHNIAAVSGSWWQSDICPDGPHRGTWFFMLQEIN
ncbi:metallophosphoesterase N-terminal domain-containing protein [Marinilabilia salmonicolor]|uniref:metallophosphoesterase N-terminal domain-containing protein n=1 Tax=Marinilabilia salmonicolor TaxID=989 RepID=UPI0006840923|nr:metallophosphoesterase N-terminal domain-containing protein [Marinilabilia salmonicolor]